MTEKEKSLQETYSLFIKIGTNQDPRVELLDEIVISDVMGYGTTEHEKISTLAALKELIHLQAVESQGLEILWAITPIYRFRSLSGDNAVFVDEMEGTITVDNEITKIYLRFSSVLEYIENTWKVVHWHGSKPENVAGEKDTWGLDIWKQKNEELEIKVAEKTAELILKNRELEIETSLEKVRSIAMSIKVPEDMLGVCQNISQQLQSLGVKEIRNVQTAIFDIKKGTYMNYEYYAKHNKTFITDASYTNHKLSKAFGEKMLKGKGEFFITHIKGKKVKEWIEYQKKTNVFIDKFLYTSDSLNYYWYSLGPVALGITTYFPLTDEETILFKRFLNVFELAYRRYLDIEKAFAQAREAEIDLALERIRARTMAMQHSDELSEASFLLDQQVRALGIKTRGCAFNIYSADDSSEWFSSEAGTIPTYKTPRENIFKKYYEIGLSGKSLHIEEFDDKACAAHYDYLETIPIMGDDIRQLKQIGAVPERQLDHVAYFKYGYLLFVTLEAAPDAHDIFIRFAKVFEQTYTRFLDLQNAEASAREAQIEASLERVRSRSLAMHNTSELQDVIHSVHKEFLHLNIAIDGGSFIAINSDIDTTLRCWGSGGTADTTEEVNIPLYKKPFCANLINRIKKGPGFFTEAFTQKEKIDFFTFLFKHEPWSKLKVKVKKETLSSPGGYTRSVCVSEHTSIFIINHHGEIFSTTDNDILQRFGKVFEQSYTRFLDLQKAEAQAREAEIELALERVRARTMAMQKSTELNEVAFVLFEQIKLLGGNLWGTGFGLCNSKEGEDEFWFANEMGVMPPVNIPNTKDEVHVAMYEAWKNKQEYFKTEKEGKELKAHYKYLNSLPAVKAFFQPMLASGIQFPDWQQWHAAYFSKGYLLIITVEPYAEPEIFKRFAKVFDQTYTRFLDLQKAEAQAREAQIEAAVERVRAEAMAMHSTSDFEKVVKQLLQQIQHLSLEGFTGAQIILIDEKEFLTTWDCSSPGNIGDPKSQTMRYEAKKFPILGLEVLNKWKEGHPYFVMHFDLQKLRAAEKEWLDIDVNIARVINDAISGGHLTHQWEACGRLSNGMIAFDMIKPPDDDVRNITLKMTHAFEQAYIRFLDLQKAEASAREAQIEAALEKVRSRSLAMHKSDELNEVVAILFEKLKELQIPATAVGIAINIEGSKDLNAYVCGENNDGLVMTNYRAPYFNNKIFKDLSNALEQQLDFFVGRYSKKEKDAFYKYIIEHTEEFKHLPEDIKNMIFECQSYTISMVAVKNAVFNINDFEGKVLAEKDVDIIKRFAKVFDQAYTRFLDLQKSEAQAREAEIDLALERVRSQAMAMQKSSDLLDIVVTMRTEFTRLGHEAHYFWHMMWLPDKYEKAMTSGDGTKIGFVMELPRHIHGDIPLLAKWEKSKKPTEVYAMNVEEALDYVHKMVSLGDFKHIDPQAPSDDDIRHIGGLTFIMARTTHGEIGFSLPGVVENPPKEDIDILIRFAGAFDIAHRRFLDLQKSEAQSREVEIELALEKVRSRSMGMQKSEELKEVIQVVYDEFVQLKINVEHTGFIIDYKENDDMHIWLADRNKVPSEVTIPYFDTPHWNSFIDAKKSGKDFFANQFSFEEKNKFYKHLFKLITGVPNDTIDYYYKADGLAISTVLIDNVGLYIENFKGIPYSDEENKILMRFGKVFQQTYTRFLDLQKAEAQAREAQIEVALEKVRSRSMAMYSSDELLEASDVMLAELEKLKINALRIGICTMDANTGASEIWTRFESKDKKGSKILGVVPKGVHHVFDDMVKSWLNKEPYFTNTRTGKDVVEYYKKLVPFLPYPLPKTFNESETISCFFFLEGSINVLSKESLNNDECKIVLRFAKVFEQTYTRFLDLQKAEDLAREGQIELALERVRARTMAMQHSDELQDAAIILFQQLKNLGIETGSCGFNIWDENEKTATVWMSSPEGGLQIPFTLPHTESKIYKEVFKAKENKQDFTVIEVKGKALVNHFDYLLTLPGIGDVIKGLRENHYVFPEKLIYNIAFFNNGYLTFHTYESVTEAHPIFKRFAKAFEQTYTRFLDLQKAEAQAREAQIEASLERLRSKTMAMHNSTDVGESVATLFDELARLGLLNAIDRCGIGIMRPNEKMDVWTASKTTSEKTELTIGYLDMQAHQLLVGAYQGWIEKKKTFQYILEGDDRLNYYEAMLKQSEYKIKRDYFSQPVRIFHSDFYFNEGCLYVFSHQAFGEEDTAVFIRFAGVFGQTYRRYLDLKKAEAQAKEAQIEAALERIRSQSMGMQTSKDLSHVTTAMFEQLRMLGGDLFAMGIVFCDKHEGHVEQWHSLPDAGMISPFIVPVNLDYIHQYRYDQWKQGSELFSIEIPGDFIEQHFSDIFNLPSAQIVIKEFEANNTPMPATPPWEIDYGASFKHGYILASALQPFAEAEILPRFAKVFEQTYIRFLDLQKAEAQAREAKIEMALEKIRSRTMAMQRSDELPEAANLLFLEVQALGIPAWSCGYNILSEDKKSSTCIMSSEGLIQSAFHLPFHNSGEPSFAEWLEAVDKQEPFFVQELSGKKIEDHYNYMKTLPQVGQAIKELEDAGLSLPTYQINHLCRFLHGFLLFITYEPVPHAHDIFQRFTKVFEQTYTRFLDLQKAEAQAREAQVEAALEKVRGKAMAMHNSGELTATASLVFTELRSLGVNSIRFGVGVMNKKSKNGQIYAATSTAHGDALGLIGTVDFNRHPVMLGFYNSFIENKEYFPELTGKLIQSYYEALSKGLTVSIPVFKQDQKEYGISIPLSIGSLYAWSDSRYDEDQLKIIRRFASIIDLTFRRYFELQKAESNAKEAIKQAALDRIRAEIASMRTVSDLDRITPLIWKELTTLGIAFLRCGVFIMDDVQEQIHTFLSTPEGNAIAAFHLPYGTGNLIEAVDYWRAKKIYITHWGEAEFSTIANVLVQQNNITTREQYLSTLLKEGIHLHFLPFLQGMLYVGNITEMASDDLLLVQSLADAFSTAYARYEDFTKLEASKQQVDNTLKDLRAAQNQLVQSEKMASLGELTAGIAHEIQNPLNFVNNFSEVSKELLDEMNEELEKGNLEDVRDIMKDVIKNLEKINHHGKRADGIVKGMLQHSRSSSGTKEATDINALCDEFLRLAYHGLRAKDKTFNADFNTDFDPNLPKIAVIPQDIGRVILNIINNAFYAVNERSKKGEVGYNPSVTISTELTANSQQPNMPTTQYANSLIISIKDNGLGIPAHIKEKIFQPFFTTKPTGSGTGLGLSLAYDIVTKGHGGELSVETKEGEGTTFSIQLSI